MQEMQKEDARALLQSTQQLRTHWSSVIVNLINYVIILNVAVWSFFLKAYIDNTKPSYIILAALLSSISLVLWRLYTHYLDHRIALLYPDFLLCEEILSVPYGHGTRNYLIRNVPNLKPLFLDIHLDSEQQLQAIARLVRRKRIGQRGHRIFDILALSLILVMFLGSLCVFLPFLSDALSWLYLVPLALVLTSSILLRWLYFQKDPRGKDIEDAIEAATRSSGQ